MNIALLTYLNTTKFAHFFQFIKPRASYIVAFSTVFSSLNTELFWKSWHYRLKI